MTLKTQFEKRLCSSRVECSDLLVYQDNLESRLFCQLWFHKWSTCETHKDKKVLRISQILNSYTHWWPRNKREKGRTNGPWAVAKRTLSRSSSQKHFQWHQITDFTLLKQEVLTGRNRLVKTDSSRPTLLHVHMHLRNKVAKGNQVMHVLIHVQVIRFLAVFCKLYLLLCVASFSPVTRQTLWLDHTAFPHTKSRITREAYFVLVSFLV